jgi:predicted ATPase
LRECACLREPHRRPYPRDAGTGRLLTAILGPEPELAPVKARLIERPEGNAFFLEESVRALAETEILVGEPGAYRLAKPLASLQVVGVPRFGGG